MNTNKTSLDWIRELALRLADIAHNPDAWEQYRIANEGKDVVIDRAENNLARYVREVELHLSALYDADTKLDSENQQLRQRLQNVADKARNSQQQGQILIAIQIEEALSDDSGDDDELNDNGVYEDDVVIHAPYDDEDE